MKTLQIVQTADAEKKLHLTIPVDEPSRRYRITVAIEPDLDVESEADDKWPEGFFARTAGKWVGDLVRQPQGDYEQRAKL